MIKEVIQRFDPAHEVFWDVCHEWDEDFAMYFDVPVRKIIVGNTSIPATTSKTPDTQAKNQSISRKIISLIKKFPGARDFARYIIPPLHQNIAEPLSLGIAMSPVTTGFMRGTSCIPVFLDVWSKADFFSVMRQTRGFKLFYVTARDVFNRIKAKDPSSGVH